MGQLTRFATSVARAAVATAPAAMLGIGAGTAAATPTHVDGGTILPFSMVLRRCDFSDDAHMGSIGYGSGFAIIRTTESNKVTAEVHLQSPELNTHYDVRLIQVPRPSWLSCGPGDPGTAVDALVTDAAGTATVTLQDDRRPGATGAWVLIERPQAGSQTPGEFYTTDFVAAI
jgi:hypothetical protein